MAERVDISRLGGNEHDLNRTSVVFLKDKAPMHIAFNNYVVEGEWEEVAVVKENGNSRPFLVIDHPELHAKVAIYLTSSITEQRMALDNALRGEHLFETPYALMNYISKSSVTGKVDDGKLSVIDRDRFFFITDDWIDEKESRAKGYGQFNIGLNAHAQNLREIDEILSKDLRRKNYTQIITGKPTTELWVYKMGAQKPVSYHPSAEYLMLALNMMVQYKNERNNLSTESLSKMADLAGRVSYVYSEYISYLDRLKALEVKNTRLYNAFIQTRYWHEQVTERMEQNIRNNIKEFGFFSKNNSYRYLYGNPKHKEGANLDDIITQEFQNCGIRESRKDAELKYSNRSMVKELLSGGQYVYSLIDDATQEVVEFLTELNEEERINLSSFGYAESFWESFYDRCDSNEYIEQLCKDLEVKYRHLALEKQKHETQKRTKRASLDKIKKEQERAEKEREKVREQKIKSLEKRIDNTYIEQYLRAFRAYEQGKLIPVPVEELQEITKFSLTGLPNYDNLTIGSKLATKFRQDLVGMSKLNEQMTTLLNMSSIAEKKLSNPDKFSANENNVIALMNRISDVEEKVTKKNKKLPAKERKSILKAEIHEMLLNLPADELDAYLSDDFDLGRSGEEVLRNMQDVFHARTTMRSYANLRNNRLEILNALETINEDKLINDFKLSQEAMDELQTKGLVLPIDLTTLSVSEINSGLNKIAQVLQKKTPTKDDYKAIQDSLQASTVKMRKFTAFSQKLLEERTKFLLKLEKYNHEMDGILEDTYKEIDNRVKVFEEEIAKNLEDPECAGYIKHKEGGWVSVNNPERRLTDEEMNHALKTYWENTAECRNHKNFCNPEEDKKVIGAIYEKLYPSAEQILQATRKSVAGSKNIDDAISHYKSAEKLLEQLTDEKEKFKLFMAGEYDYILYAAEDLLEIAINWGYMMSEQGDAIVKQIDNFDYPPAARQAVLNAVDRVCYAEKENVKREFDEFKTKFRRRVQDVVAGYQPRTQIFQPLEHYLSKSSAKNMTIDGASMPKSVLGDNGVVERFQEYAQIKQRQCEILGAIANREGDRYPAHEVASVHGKTYKQITNAIDAELYKAQEEEVAQEILTLKESLRAFAKRVKSNEIYVQNPQALEADVKKLKKVDRNLTTIATSFKRPGDRNLVYGVDYFSFCDEVIKMLPDVRKTLEEQEAYTKEVNGKKLKGHVDADWVDTFADIRSHFENSRLRKGKGSSYLKDENGEDEATLVVSALKKLGATVKESGREDEFMEMMPNISKLLKQLDANEQGEGDQK